MVAETLFKAIEAQSTAEEAACNALLGTKAVNK